MADFGRSRSWPARLAAVGTIALAGLVLASLQQARASEHAGGLRDGLVAFLDAADGLADLGPLGTEVPFTAFPGTSGITATGPGGIDLAHLSDELGTALAGQTFTSVADLEDFLDDPDQNGDDADDADLVTASGLTLDVDATISEAVEPGTLHGLSLSLTAQRTVTVPFQLPSSEGLIGDDLDVTFSLSTTLPFAFDSALPEAERFWLVGGPTPPTIDVGYDAAVDVSTPATVTIGVLQTQLGGAGSSAADLVASIDDPDDDGTISVDELGSTLPVDLFDVAWGSSGADLALTLTSDLPGLAGVTGSVSLADDDLADGVDAPTVTLGTLSDFRNIGAPDLLTAIAQVASALETVQIAGGGDPALPFVGDSLATLAPFNAQLGSFFTGSGLSTPEDPFNFTTTPATLQNVDTIQEAMSLLRSTLGMSADDFALGYDTANQRLTFELRLARPTSVPAASIEVDFGEELAAAGVTDVDDGSSAATIDPSFDLSVGVGIGLQPSPDPSDPLSITDRTTLETTGQELTLDAPIAADLAMTGRIGFLGLTLADTSASPVPLLQRRTAGTPMVALDVTAPGNRVTIADLFDDLGTHVAPPTLNMAVPSTALVATAASGSETLATGTLTVAWPDITTGAPTVATDAAFDDQLLDFDFDQSNPLALFEKLLDAAEAVAAGVDDLAGTGLLSTDLPIIGESFDSLGNRFGEIRTAINDLLANPATTLQTLTDRFEAELAALGADVDLDVVHAGGTPTVIAHLDFGVCSAAGTGCTNVLGRSAPFTLPFDVGGGLVGAAGTATFDYSAIASLDFGVTLPSVTRNPGAPHSVSGAPEVFVLDSSTASLAADANLSGVLAARLGSLEISLGRAADPGTPGDTGDPYLARLGTSMILSEDAGAAGATRLPVGSPDLTAWLGGLAPTSIGGAAKTCNGGSTSGEACAHLPVFTSGSTTPLGTVEFLAPSLANPGGWTFTGAPELLEALVAGSFDFDFDSLSSGLDLLAGLLDSALDAASFGASLPVVGDALGGAADVGNIFRTEIVQPAQAFVAELEALAEPSQVGDAIDAFFVTQAGDLLVDADGSSTPSAGDVAVTMTCDDGIGSGSGDGAVGPTPCLDAVHSVADIYDIAVALSLGDDLLDEELDFDIGLPGLDLDTTSPVQADSLWELDLAFGISVIDGFYLRTDNPVDGAAAPEATITTTVDLPNLEGHIAFIPAGMTDAQDARPDADLTIGADLTGGGADKKLSFADLSSGLAADVAFDVGISGQIDVQLAFLTGGLPGEDSTLPQFGGTFVLQWGFAAGTAIDGLDTDALVIRFDDVKVNLGSFLDSFLGPIARDVYEIISPVKPVLDFINAPIPVLSELYEIFGEDKLTVLKLMELQGQDVTFLRRLIFLADVIEQIATAQSQGEVVLGSMIIDGGEAAAGALSATEKAAKLIESLPVSIPQPLADLAGDFISGLDDAAETGGLTFPAFEDPKQLFHLLVGTDVDLVRFDAGKLEAEVKVQAKFGPPIGIFPISVAATATFGVRGHLEVGYDTFGIRQAVRNRTDGNDANNGFFDDVDAVLQGIFIDDLKDGVDVPEISLYGRVTVGAALDILVAEAGVRGGLGANLDLNAHDGGLAVPPPAENLDGKLRIDEIISFLENPVCMFDISGQVTAFLELYADTILTPEETWTLLGPVTLIDFDGLNDDCFDPPALAHVDGGRLVLNTGKFADRRDYKEEDPNEVLLVRQLDTDSFSVAGYGFQQEYHGITNGVFADGAGGNDSFTMQEGGVASTEEDGTVTSEVSGFTQTAVLCGGDHADTLIGGGAGDTIAGDGELTDAWTCTTGEAPGDGIDNINGQGGGDTLTGQGAADTLTGGAGGDNLDGGTGGDRLIGNGGADTITGGPDTTDDGNDTIFGGTEVDTVHAGGGDDEVKGDEGADILNGQTGADRLNGDAGIDTINGGPQNDTIRGGGDGDILSGNEDDDDMFGDDGGDAMHGGTGTDDMFGGPGTDTMNGDDGDDVMVGDGEVDTMNGGPGSDRMDGSAGGDVMHGNDGPDEMHGGPDGDQMFGDAGTDTMFGDDGDDTMSGGTEGDAMRGGPGNDAMAGNEGQDTMFGDSGNDDMAGNDDVDTMRGGIAADCMFGNGAGDVMTGDDGDDRLAGGSPTAGAADGADQIDGNGGADVVAGDNADVCGGHLVLFDLPFIGAVAPPDTASGADDIDGGAGDDTLYGQGKSELPILGGAGDDYIEGNEGADLLEGGDGADDIVGGSGHDLGGPAGARRQLPNVVDENVDLGSGPVGDTINGGAGVDFIAGDNADIGRSPRTLVLYDVDFAGDAVTEDPLASGNDVVNGGSAADVIYGQGDDDLLHGDAGDDYIEGNQDADQVFGDAGQDDLVGGSGLDDGGPGGTRRELHKALDDADTMHGNDGIDYLLGDNGSVTRPGGVDPANGAIIRLVKLYDVETLTGDEVSVDVHGDEVVITGDAGDDWIFGQGGNDVINGSDGHDDIEGNHGQDTIQGGPGQDDLTGGGSANDGLIVPTRVGDGLLDDDDLIYGELDESQGTATGSGADVIVGDNGRILRVVVDDAWEVDPGTEDFVRDITMFDLEPVDQPPADVTVHGADELWGNDNDDIIRGQGGPDEAHGGAGDDDIEGNPGSDRLFGEDDQDDMIGGSRTEARRDAGDELYGGRGADYQLGDNGTLVRTVLADGYLRFVEANTETIVRVATRFDLEGSADAFGDDYLQGDAGDDYQWGQDGDDEMHGNDHNDDMYGELGDDRMFGEAGEDAMLGDRGGIVDRRIDGSAGDPASFTLSINPPPRITFVAFRNGVLDRRFDLLHDSNAAGTGFQPDELAAAGFDQGGEDFMRGGPGHDSMHGAFGDDLMNGDAGGDILFGDDGADVMWGGRGCDPTAGEDCGPEGLAFRGTNDVYVDYLFGGHGSGATGTNGVVTGGADLHDYRPRAGIDPDEWFEITDLDDDAVTGEADQHHQGIDWMYGGWDRDIMQGDITANGPNDGDKLLDWNGAYNLYTHCNAAYGGYNDVRQHSPGLEAYLKRLSYALGAGPTEADVDTSGRRSGFRELGFVYSTDIQENSGKAYPTTPGHFEDFACS